MPGEQPCVDRLVGTILVERYRVMRKLGNGGMGSVYLGEHITIRKPVAIKLLARHFAAWPEYVERFLQEARAASSIRHRNTIDITDFGYTEPDRLPFFVMEYLDGQDLREVLQREGTMPWPRARELMLQICAAIEAAHIRCVVHRDIKPANCFLVVDEDGTETVKVLDFGLAKVTSHESLTAFSSHGVVMGTPEYIAPERVLNQQADHRADIYSLGVLLFRMTTGTLPFIGESATEVVAAHVHQAPPSPSAVAPHADISPELDAVILKALAKRPAERFASAAELADAMRALDPISLSGEHSGDFFPALLGEATEPDYQHTTRPRATRAGARGSLDTGDLQAKTIPMNARSRRAGLRNIVVAGATVLGIAAVALLMRSFFLSDRELSSFIEEDRLRSFAALPAQVHQPTTKLAGEQAELGQLLYHDPRLSKSGELSCNSCHDLQRHGVDGKDKSIGHKGRPTRRNTSSTYNLAGQFAFFWDARGKLLEVAALGPLTNPNVMASTEAGVKATLQAIPEYVERFRRAFPKESGEISMDTVSRALAEFHRRLVTPSRWDRFLAGDTSALNAKEKAGFNVFVDAGCVTCHYGPYIGGDTAQKVGLLVAWPNQRDLGLYEHSGDMADHMKFKVPSLRNVAMTGPYFHDGSVDSLTEAIELMARHQLGKTLSDREVSAIAAWLEALTGDIPEDLATSPKLPPSKSSRNGTTQRN